MFDPNLILHSIELNEAAPELLNNPFLYTPSQDIILAQRYVMHYLEMLSSKECEIERELQQGKMMGVMIVRDSSGDIYYLAAFSGCLAGRIEVAGFVPPIFGRGDLNSEFEACDRAIGALGERVAAIENSEEYLARERSHKALVERVERERQEMSQRYAEAKCERDEARKTGTRTIEALQLESQRQKGAMKRRERELKCEVDGSQLLFDQLRGEIERLKEERREMSFELQREMFKSYKVVNGKGESRSLYSIFDELNGHLPPSGAGECAAPKLLHYALIHSLTPLSIGEFWYGGTPRAEVRRHGEFYGACKSRCEPILGYMLEGVAVESIERPDEPKLRDRLNVIFEDEYLLLLDKPSGLLSVPGRSSADSVASIVRERYPSATGAMIVHRLDQDTSGLLLVAKSAEVHKALQRQFSERTLSKRYVAVVEGVVEADRGEITLPLITNFDDRPRQMVSYEYGKSSRTTFEVLERTDATTRLRLTPHTGRTHQLRVHCAHAEGLNRPIVGDRLYGKSGERLLLHAEQLTLQHPVTGERMHFELPAQF